MNSEIKPEKRSRDDEGDQTDQPDIQKVSIKEYTNKSTEEQEVNYYKLGKN
jgi:hypothetical protein